MSTISKRLNVSGFCPIDNENVPIEIEYISFPIPERDRNRRLFIKNSNKCYYLKEGKCDKNKLCPIYQNAEIEKYLDI